MPPKLAYAVLFVEKMDRAVAFYRDTLGLPLKFQSPEWSEFLTGETTLALHAASPEKPAGLVELGFNVADIHAFHKELVAKAFRSPCRLPSRTSAAPWPVSRIPKAPTSSSAARSLAATTRPRRMSRCGLRVRSAART